MNRIRVFVCFDREHDRDLRDRLAVESQRPDSRFEVTARSATRGEAEVRSAILAVDEVIVICGKHSDSSPQMTTELRIAQELKKPYFLLWGRRDQMCTRPLGFRPEDAMYGWTREIIQSQTVVTLRDSQPRPIPEHYKKHVPTAAIG